MTTLERLHLRGIRSYGTDEDTIIKFFKPLTIILGRNGSGKSTIIEAIKMATTGATPPAVGQGAAFIHDPRIHNEVETAAHIHLQFTDVRGYGHIVSRKFKLTMTKTPRLRNEGDYKPKFAQVAQNLTTNDGTNSPISRALRVEELNNCLPDILRVTKPVLDSVLFVHQEDSLWPLDTTDKLKKRFDDIFGATRYTSALKAIRDHRTNQDKELKIVDVEILRYEDKVKVIEKLRAKVDEIRIKHDALRQGVDMLDNDIARITTERDAAQVVATKYDNLCTKLERIRIESGIIEDDKREKYSAMQLHLPDMTDEAIVSEMDELESFLHRATGERSNREKLIQQMREDITGKRKELHVRQNRKGMLEQEAKMQKDRKFRLDATKERLGTLSLFARKLASGGGGISLPSKSASNGVWSDVLRALVQDAAEHVNEVSQKGENTVDASRTQLTDIKMQLQEAKANKNRITEQITLKRSKASAIRDELRSLDDLDVAIRNAESKLKAVDDLLKEKAKSSTAQPMEERITNKRKDLAALREDLSVLRRARGQLVQYQSEHVKYDQWRETAAKWGRRAEVAAEEFRDNLLSAEAELSDVSDSGLAHVRHAVSLSDALTQSNAERRKAILLDSSSKVLAKRDIIMHQAERSQNEASAASKVAKERCAEQEMVVEEAHVQLRNAQQEVSCVSDNISNISQTCVDVHEATALLQSITLSCESRMMHIREEQMDSVKEIIKIVDDAALKANQRLALLDSGVLLAEGDLTQFEEDPKHKCPACGLASTKRVEDMRKNLQSRVELFKDPESSQRVKEEVQNLERTSGALAEAHAVGTRVSASYARYSRENQKLKSLKQIVQDCNNTGREADIRLERVRKCCGPGTAVHIVPSKRIELSQAFTDWERAEKEVESLRASLPNSTNDSRSLSDVDEDIKSIEESLQDLHDSIDRDSRKLEREREDLRSAESRFHTAKQQHLELQSKAERHKRLHAENEELAETTQALVTEVEMLRNEVAKRESEQDDAEAEFATVRAENSMILDNANRLASMRKSEFDSWQDCFRDIEAYIHSGKESELETLVMSLAGIEETIESLSSDLHAHEKDQQTASDSQRNMESKIRNLRDNQRYRVQERKLQANNRSARHVQDDIDVLKRETSEDPLRAVKQLDDVIHKKQSQRSATAARRQGYTDSYKEGKKELDAAEKEGSREKFEECRIRRQTMKLASSDLNAYHEALDEALMTFHTLKMSSINQTIKELWQQIYRGTDIDEIEITSDHGGPGTAWKRNFSYAVQMRQNHATLDMRGRCSAGQKVLACLVIRLALAESFCVDCGILALDEPTTNLDRDNVASLALAIKAIIEARKTQRNFQLILITHDQEFIEMIGAREYGSEYFVVYKDTDGISKARIQHLHEI